MDATELRIGNLVYIQSEKLGADIKKVFRIKTVTTQEQHKYKPIPLTEEWLLKLGFINSNIPYRGFAIEANSFTYVLSKSNNAYCIGIVQDIIDDGLYNFAWDIKYVHHLQNLFFTLAGKELEILTD